MKKLLINMPISTAILFFWLFLFFQSCGPSAEQRKYMEIHHTDTIPTDAQMRGDVEPVSIPVASVSEPVDPDKVPNHTYDANDFGLIPGVIVRWVPRSIPDEYTDFPIVFIHIRQENGITKIMRADQNIWTNLNTGDTLR